MSDQPTANDRIALELGRLHLRAILAEAQRDQAQATLAQQGQAEDEPVADRATRITP